MLKLEFTQNVGDEPVMSVGDLAGKQCQANSFTPKVGLEAQPLPGSDLA